MFGLVSQARMMKEWGVYEKSRLNSGDRDTASKMRFQIYSDIDNDLASLTLPEVYWHRLMVESRIAKHLSIVTGNWKIAI